MSSEMLYKLVSVCRRLGDREAVVHRCLELLPGQGFVVQSADRVRLPLRLEDLQHQERQFWELFCEVAPEERAKPYPSLEQTIAAFDAEFGN
jgi:DNA-binding IclR family transcriptional regulator